MDDLPPAEIIINPTGQAPLVSPPTVDFGPVIGPAFDWLKATYPAAFGILQDLFGLLIGLCLVFSVIFIIVIVYSVEQLKRIRRKEEQIYDLKVEPAYEEDPVAEKGNETLAKRWQTVSDHIASENPNDWKQGIMEADIMLDEILTHLGYKGESIGEKLKRAEPADFGTLNDAWEAHKVRNQIAHEGSAFNLNHTEAKRVYNLYKRVFEEFYYL